MQDTKKTEIRLDSIEEAIDDIKNAADTLQTVLTTGKLPVQHDSSFYFNYSVLWHDPPLSIDTLLMPLSQANKVFMVDTLAPSNTSTIFAKSDSARVSRSTL